MVTHALCGMPFNDLCYLGVLKCVWFSSSGWRLIGGFGH